MIFWIIQQILISLAIIALTHYLYKIIQNKFSTPKVIDLVNHPAKEYNKICKIINLTNDNEPASTCSSSSNNDASNNIDENVKETSKNLAPTNANLVPTNANLVPTNANIVPTNMNSHEDTTLISGLDEKKNLYNDMNGELQSYFDSI